MAFNLKQIADELKKKIQQTAQYFSPQEQNKYVDAVLNKAANIPRFQLPQSILPTNTSNPLLNLGRSVVRGAVESPINIPRNLIAGYSRLEKEQLDMLRQKRLPNLQNVAAGAANLGEAALDLFAPGIGKGVAVNASKNALAQGTKFAVKKGIVQGAIPGALGGLAYGVGNQYQKPFDAGEVGLNTVAGGALGGVLGGATSVVGSLWKMTDRPQQLTGQLRDLAGRFKAGDVPIRPKGMPKPQWEFQLKVNKDLGRNPYTPIYPSDLQKLIKDKGGLSVKKLTKFEHDQNVAKSAQAGLYDISRWKNEFGNITKVVNIDDLKIKEDQINRDLVEQIKKSIRAGDQSVLLHREAIGKSPAIRVEDDVVIDGTHRYLALKELGIKTAPAEVISGSRFYDPEDYVKLNRNIPQPSSTKAGLYDTPLYHGSNAVDANTPLVAGKAGVNSRGSGIYLTPDKSQAEVYGKVTIRYLNPNAKIADFSNPENLVNNKQLQSDFISGLDKLGVNPRIEDGWIKTDKGNLDLMGVSQESFNRFVRGVDKKYGEELVKSMGYDVAKFPNEKQVVVYNPSAIKNVAQQPLGDVTKGNLNTQTEGFQKVGKIISPTQSESVVPTRTMASQEVASPNIIPEKGKLNIKNLNVQGEGKKLLQSQEAGVIPTVIGNKQVVDMARTAKGTRTLTDQKMQELMAQQLKNRQLVVDLTEQFNNARKSGASDVELAKIMLNIADQSETARQGGTFAGRLLQAQNILADQSASPMQKIFALLDNAGADKTKYIQDAVKVDWENPTQVVDFYRKYVPPKFGEILDEIRYSNMLSSPLTHIVNTTSNALQTGVIAPVEKTITGALDWGKSALTGSERQYYARSGVDYASGYVRALPEAFKKFKNVLSGEQVLVKPDYERIPTGTKGILSAYTTPLKMLEAADQFFKTLVESGVTNELKNGPRKLTMEQISSNATKEANYRLFRQAFDPNGELGSGIVLKTFDKWNSAIANLRRLPGGKWVLPFLQTPTNILKQGVEFSPLGVTTMVGAKAPIEQLSKAIIGTAVFSGAYGLAKSGMTTWDAPASGTERDLFYSAGMQPYSVKIGNNWVSYSKLGPLSYPLAMAAALASAEKKNPDQSFISNVGKGVSGILGFFGDQSYVRSIGDLVDAIRGGGNIGSSAFTSEASNLAGQLVPYHSFLTWLGRMTDPTYRKAATFVDKMKKDLPILGSSLKPYVDLQGNPSKRDYPVLNAVSPYQVTQQKLPEAKMLFDVQTKKIQNEVSKRADEAFLAGDSSQQKTGDIYRYVDDNGAVKKIDLSFPTKEYKPTGNTLLDKELLSDYRGSITTAKNNVIKAWELGAITQEQAIKELEKLVSKSNSVKGPKKPKKITFKATKYTPAKITVSKGIKTKLPTIKFKKPKVTKTKIKRFSIKA